MIEFWKYHGIGNDFVVIDGTKADPGLTPEQIAFLCDRNFGIGSDGVIYVNPGMDGSDVTMRIFNTDGTEPEMCGNGVRCLAKHAYDFGIVKSPDFVIHTGKGNLGAHCTLGADGKVDSVRIDMGAPILDPPSVPVKGDGDRVMSKDSVRSSRPDANCSPTRSTWSLPRSPTARSTSGCSREVSDGPSHAVQVHVPPRPPRP